MNGLWYIDEQIRQGIKDFKGNYWTRAKVRLPILIPLFFIGLVFSMSCMASIWTHAYSSTEDFIAYMIVGAMGTALFVWAVFNLKINKWIDAAIFLMGIVGVMGIGILMA